VLNGGTASALTAMCAGMCLRHKQNGAFCRISWQPEDPMPYLLLIVEPTGQRAERSPAEGHAAYDAMVSFGAELHARGVLQAGQSLATKAARVQVQDGRVRTVDGPFAECKELIGGFFLVDVATREEALELAALCPAAAWCTVEVREVGPCWT
jgi:hypothetical protein